MKIRDQPGEKYAMIVLRVKGAILWEKSNSYKRS